jgi:3-dehydroquinate dehydratase/shikimate dehydrogenase
MNVSSNYVPRIRPHQLPKVCVAVVGRTAEEMVEKAEALVRDNPFVEFRLDYLPHPLLALKPLQDFLEYHPHVYAIATCRRAANGGKFRGSIAAELDILGKAAAAGCQLVDLELQTALKTKAPQLKKLRERAALILSYHDFRGTKKLEETLATMEALQADFYKIVGTATTLHDNVVMMKFLEEQSYRHSLIGLCMGEQGIISRVLGQRAGSVFTFASLTAGEETAPGQVTAKMLRDIYRVDKVDTATRVYGVAGDPVAHSLSPLLMNIAFRRENVNAVYLALHAKTMKDLRACMSDIPISGLSVTMPYKQEILEDLDNTDPYTAKTGACNTVVRGQDGKLYGFNTDVAGVIRPLEQRIALTGAKVLVLGAGGGARAAVFGLKERGAEVWILNRSAAKGQKLAKSARVKVLRRADLKKLTFDIILNATPVGMGHSGSHSKEMPLKPEELKARYVFDMVYDPLETPLLRAARARGLEVIPGIEMFVQQAARQFEIWTGKPAPADEMRRVALMELQERAAQATAKKK